MRKYKNMLSFIIFIISISLVFSFGVTAKNNSEVTIKNKNLNSLESTVVKKVIDGDTIKISNGETIRFIGIDTPEINWDIGTADFYGYKALNFTKNNLLNKKIYLEYDEEKRDDYGRLLAYVYLENGELFNDIILKKGYGHLMTVEPNTKYLKKFRKVVKKAREKEQGIWRKIKQSKEKAAVISWKEAEKFYGKTVIVEGKIKNTYKAEEVTFLNFAENYNETLTIIIFNDNLNKFACQPENYFLNKNIRVIGEVKEYEGSPEIIVENPTSILVN